MGVTQVSPTIERHRVVAVYKYCFMSDKTGKVRVVRMQWIGDDSGYICRGKANRGGRWLAENSGFDLD